MSQFQTAPNPPFEGDPTILVKGQVTSYEINGNAAIRIGDPEPVHQLSIIPDFARSLLDVKVTASGDLGIVASSPAEFANGVALSIKITQVDVSRDLIEFSRDGVFRNYRPGGYAIDIIGRIVADAPTMTLEQFITERLHMEILVDRPLPRQHTAVDWNLGIPRNADEAPVQDEETLAFENFINNLDLEGVEFTSDGELPLDDIRLDTLPDIVSQRFPQVVIKHRQDEIWGGISGYWFTFPNDWRVSVVFGPFTRSTNEHHIHLDPDEFQAATDDHWSRRAVRAEVAAFSDEENWYIFESGGVTGDFKTVAEILEFIQEVSELP